MKLAKYQTYARRKALLKRQRKCIYCGKRISAVGFVSCAACRSRRSKQRKK